MGQVDAPRATTRVEAGAGRSGRSPGSQAEFSTFWFGTGRLFSRAHKVQISLSRPCRPNSGGAETNTGSRGGGGGELQADRAAAKCTC